MKYGAERRRQDRELKQERKERRAVPPLPNAGALERMRAMLTGAVKSGILPKVEPVDPGPPTAGSQFIPDATPKADIFNALDIAVGRAWRSLAARLRRPS